ncbi:MAG: hypothetical protein HY319_10075 [Armatimonadetes bacterium]|nr:hypothetical protein [Armatimonadota bacterium]
MDYHMGKGHDYSSDKGPFGPGHHPDDYTTPYAQYSAREDYAEMFDSHVYQPSSLATDVRERGGVMGQKYEHLQRDLADLQRYGGRPNWVQRFFGN